MPFDATKLRAHDVTLRPLPRSEGGGGPYRDRTRAGSATGTLHGGACVGAAARPAPAGYLKRGQRGRP
jgi:hypothetical protein